MDKTIISLYEEVEEGKDVEISASIDEEGDLFVEGFEASEFSDSILSAEKDYEFWYIIDCTDKDWLLLNLLKAFLGSEKNFGAKLEELLKSLGIEYEYGNNRV